MKMLLTALFATFLSFPAFADALTDQIQMRLRQIGAKVDQGGNDRQSLLRVNQLLEEAQLTLVGGGGGGGPGRVIVVVPDTDVTFGCAGSGYRGLRLEQSNRAISLKADSLRADYDWSSGSFASSIALPYVPSRDGELSIAFANGRDHTQVKIDVNGNLVGRCKTTLPWTLVKANVLASVRP